MVPGKIMIRIFNKYVEINRIHRTFEKALTLKRTAHYRILETNLPLGTNIDPCGHVQVLKNM